MNFYNENDPKAAAWLRELIAAGEIAPGVVDERSITEIKPHELTRYTQCHFFAGIGGWSYALRIAGWPDDEPIWTGSCPCQPFSAAGNGQVDKDERHLWPAFRAAIAECRPAICFGEQVASADGRIWLAGVRSDLEALGYGFGAADLCAAGVGAPHIRQRLFWMACAEYADWRCEQQPGKSTVNRGPGFGGSCGLGNPDEPGPQGRRLDLGEHAHQRTPWEASESLPCTDGKARRIEPGTFPLAHGIPGRVGLLRGYGNAIVPQVAAEFIAAAREAMSA